MLLRRVGAYCQRISIGGQWTLQESRSARTQRLKRLISLLELKAINLALLTFHKMLSLKAAHFQVGNTTALSYLMKMGGTGSREMTALAKRIWESALFQKTIITAEYLPEKFNVRADRTSRNFPDSSEWLLSPKVFQIESKLGYPRGRSIFIQGLPSTSHLYGLEIRSSQSRNRRSPAEMKKPGTSICVPPFLKQNRIETVVQQKNSEFFKQAIITITSSTFKLSASSLNITMPSPVTFKSYL